jgi:hypothetical protein
MGQNQNAAYAGQIFDSTTQKWVPLCDKVAEIEAAAIPQSGDVVHTLSLHDGRARAASTSDAFNFSTGSKPTALIFLPSLEQLGYLSKDYELKAVAQANIRTNTPPQDASIALFDADGNMVDGSQTSGTLSAAATTDNVIVSAAVAVAGGAGYAVDARMNTAGDPENITLLSSNIILQVVKK